MSLDPQSPLTRSRVLKLLITGGSPMGLSEKTIKGAGLYGLSVRDTTAGVTVALVDEDVAGVVNSYV